MNYLKEIVAFDELVEMERITPNEQALWRALMSIANKLGWAKSFTVSVLTLQSKACIDERTIYRARNRLVQRGLITVSTRGANRAASYTMNSVVDICSCKLSGTVSDSMSCSVSDTMSGTVSDSMSCSVSALNKLNETKQNETKSTGRARFESPSVDAVKAYCLERNNGLDAERFVDYYSSKGWVVGKSPMKDWKAAVRGWEKNGVSGRPGKEVGAHRYDQRSYSEAELSTGADDLIRQAREARSAI